MKLLTLFVSVCVMGGCVSTPPLGSDGRKRPPGKINHVVFIELYNRSDTAEIIDDLAYLLHIKYITSGYVGTHYEIGRESVIQDYDIGFFVAFDTKEAYLGYIHHPNHVEFIETWKPKCKSIRVFDIEDKRPPIYIR